MVGQKKIVDIYLEVVVIRVVFFGRNENCVAIIMHTLYA